MKDIYDKSTIAQDLSEVLASISFNAALIAVGYLIDEPDKTIFPPLATVLVLHMFIGGMIMYSKDIYPLRSKMLLSGKIDMEWGFRYLYWSLWWPNYLNKS